MFRVTGYKGKNLQPATCNLQPKTKNMILTKEQFDKKLAKLKKEHEKFLSKKNKPATKDYNGIYQRYKRPVLTAAHALYVTTTGNGTLYEVETKQHSITATLPISAALHGLVAVNSNTLMISDSTNNTLALVDLKQFEKINEIAVGLNPRGTVVIVPATDVPQIITPLKRTGQSSSFRDGDDGALLKGTAISYTRSAEGIVTDNVTGLQWQDDYSDNGGDINQSTWSNAQTYCSTLALDGGNWRLPSLHELRTLVDYGRVDPAIYQEISDGENNNNGFENTASLRYWSSSLSWYIDFNDGEINRQLIDFIYYVRCVRD